MTSHHVATPRSRSRRLAHWALATLTIALTGCALDATAPVRTDEATVLQVIDGDTIRARITGTKETVRLIGIDTPETQHPTKGVQCYGPEASQFLQQLLPAGSTLRIERDDESRDAYRRLLLYMFVTVNGTEVFVNREMVLRGYARPLDIAPNSRYNHVFVQAAFDAHRNSRGLWKWCK